MVALDSIRVHRYLSTVFETVALLANMILFYLIQANPSFSIRQFKSVFMLTCVGDTLLSVLVLFGQPSMLFAGNQLDKSGYFFLIPNGWFSGRSSWVDHIAMTLFCVMLHTNIVLVVCQFVWRNSLICGEKSFIRVRKSTCILPILWCAPQIAMAVWCWTTGYDEELNEIALAVLNENGWRFTDDSHKPFPSLVPGTSLKALLHHAFFLSSSLVGYAVIIHSQFGVLKFLRSLGVPSHHRTQRAHAEVNRALIALAITPIVYVVPVTMVSLSLLFQIPLGGALSAYLSLACPLITVANPLVTIFFVRNYRMGFLRLLGLGKAEAEPLQTCQMSGMSALTFASKKSTEARISAA